MSKLLFHAPALVALLSLTVACADISSGRRFDVEEISERHARERDQFRFARAEFSRQNPSSRHVELPGIGTLIVHECVLEGLSGKEALRLHFTWLNTTGRTQRGAKIKVVLRDPRDGAEWAREATLRSVVFLPFVRDSSFTTHIDVPTYGIHTLDDWEWRIEASSIEGWPASQT